MNEKNQKKIFKNVILPIENVSYIERCSDGTKEASPYIYKNFLHKGKAVHLSERNTSRKGARYAHKMEENLYYQLFLEKEKNILERMKRCFRTNGHLESCVNPIELKKNVENRIKDLFLKKLKNLSMTRIYRRKVFNNRLDKLKKSILHMNQVYCSSIGVEYMHIEDKIQRDWIQKRLEERVCLKNTFDFSEKVRFLSDLIAAEELERYLEIRYPGEKRFSLEGIDVLIPMLKDMIIFSGNKKVDRIILGMTHRGRINVLANIFGKPLNKIFKDEVKDYKVSGDVKYHYGCFSKFNINGKTIKLNLSFNPSHLEIVNPVVMGIARGYMDRFKKRKKFCRLLYTAMLL
ncbi:hypothetical protein [Candidatus Riesia pediculischaeffi]|uniref:oxoglutarate dehydrogenase (succinyl-transferring) n=1 Tax=Candidatus Riesia pediculischaeffi TaxID=428411 RepID=A0A1V0HKK3_9ENTR|nr:hypothetical protein [Candidatus Riesia pediculischaeffi]ARC53358.1 hypothetical protein AOQ87_01625 [Candidatus Riesia pediculischaeffi]